MDGIHDIGGREGFGSVLAAELEPVFRSDWERAVFAINLALALRGIPNGAQFRHGIEQLPPQEYLQSSYYERWLHTLELAGVRAEIFAPDDLDRRTEYYRTHPEAGVPEVNDPALVATLRRLVQVGGAGAPTQLAEPRFSVGEVVRVRADASPTGHTRRAGYVRGHVGTVVAARGLQPYPEAQAAEADESEHVYTVAFSGREIWGPEGAGTTCHIDLWEPYLLKEATT